MPDKSPLIDTLVDLDKISSRFWMESLSDRKKKELDFHDRDRDRSRIKTLDEKTYEKEYGNKKFYKATSRSTDYLDNWINKEARGKVFLDYACGNGGQAIKAAKAGAQLAIGIDISPVSVKNARFDSQTAGWGANTFFLQADAENTKLPDACIDTIVCHGMLHHLDLSYAFPELRRILKPGGKLLAVEALNYNPLIKLYRNLTPEMRTDYEKEHILSLEDIKFANRFFDIGEVKYWHISSMLAAYFDKALPLFNRLDDFLTAVPLVQHLAWMFSFELIRKSGD